MLPNKKIDEKLDAERIKAAIDPENLGTLAALDIFDSINSTNTYLLECAKVGSLSGSVCIAQQQTKGRGRHGRVWNSDSGSNLYFSMIWHFPAKQSDLSSLSIAVAVIVATALKKYGISGIELKWPNDVLFSGRKLAGILLETLPEQDDQIPVVIGIGVNLAFSSEIVEPSWIDITEITSQPCSRNYIAGLLINELLVRLPDYKNTGLRAFLEESHLYDFLLNKSVVIHAGEKTFHGEMVGINIEGELLLKKASGLIEGFRCGEVSVRLD